MGSAARRSHPPQGGWMRPATDELIVVESSASGERGQRGGVGRCAK